MELVELIKTDLQVICWFSSLFIFTIEIIGSIIFMTFVAPAR